MDLTTAPLLLGLTLALGLGSAFTMPAWSAMIPELVGRKDLHAAITLNGLAMNVSRAIGPALAGYIMALTSPGAVFLLNALSFVGVIAVLFRWKNPAKTSELPAERLLGAMRNGLRYVRHSRPVQAVMIRAGSFFFFASANWALLPLLVKHDFHGGPGDYGMVLGAIGLGAVGSVFWLPSLRRQLSTDVLKKAGATLYAATLALMAVVPTLPCLLATALVAGMAWLGVMASIQGVAQMALPAWVRARGLSMVMVVVMAGMAGGALVWGQIASHLSVPQALQIAAVGLAFSVLATWRIRLTQMEGIDLTPSMHWPAPALDQAPDFDRGPVLVTLAYQVDAQHLSEFLHLMDRQRVARQQDGAFYWQLFQDAAVSDRYLETFLAESWLEHLRQHERVTQADRLLQDQISQCLAGASKSVVTHYLAVTGTGESKGLIKPSS
jgi:MFS family permease